MIEFSKMLRLARENREITQMQVAKDTGINNKTLSGYECGISEPDLRTLVILANYYNVSVDYLLGKKDLKTIQSSIEISGLEGIILENIKYLEEGSKRDLIKYIEFLKTREINRVK